MRYLLILFLFISIEAYTQLSLNYTILQTTCSTGDCVGQIKAEGLNGTAPYIYDWQGTEVDALDPSMAINLCGGTHHLIITDALGIVLDTTVFLRVYKTPRIEISVLPGDTLYLQNPTATFNLSNLDEELYPLDGWLWYFGDGSSSSEIAPLYTYTEEGNYEVSLRIVHHTSCDTTLYHRLSVKTIELFIPNVITPNGDGKNDQLIITSMQDAGLSSSGGNQSVINDYYISNELVIYNRWSQVVYETKNYVNDWDGGELTDGVYFYVLKCVGEFGTDIFKGSLTILANAH